MLFCVCFFPSSLCPSLSPSVLFFSLRKRLHQDWHSFYVNDDKYKKRGILAGRFYDARGNPTRELREFDHCVRRGRKEKEREAAEKKL